MKYKCILVVGVLVLLIQFVFPIISYGKIDKYTALGDSIPTGYGLKNPDEENYTEKLRQKLELDLENFNNLSIDGETTEQFFNTIQTSEYTEAIKESDLITITIGSNEIFEIVKEAVSYATGVDMREDNFNEATINTFFNAELLAKVQMLLSLYEFCTTQDIMGKLNEKLNRYEEYWKKSIDYINELNPNATIVVTEFYNPYYEVSLANYDLGGFVDDIVKKMNSMLEEYSNSETNYKIARIYSTFNTTNPRLTNVNLSLFNLNIDPHPTALGHEIISLKILEEIHQEDNTQTRIDISTLTISDIENQEYTGQAIEPEIIVKDGNKTLVEEEDYVLVYYNNIEVGEASVIIAGMGEYSGRTTKNFNIYNGQTKDISSCSINSLELQMYLGFNLQPEVIITDGTYILTKDKDYTLQYNNNLNVGMAIITITGIGNYTGTVETNFIIAPQYINTTIIYNIPEQIYTGEEITPDAIVTFGGAKLVRGKDYTLSYENNIEIGIGKIIIEGKGNFTGTVTKEFNIVAEPSEELLDISKAVIPQLPDKIYAGMSITPEFVITYDGEKLDKGVDYVVYYSNNINVGTAIATIVGIGDYTGSVDTSFEIVPKSIANLKLDDIPAQHYTGEEIKPKVTITDDAIKIIENKDYTVKYSDNINIGTATIEINGIGNYTGTLIKTFNIIEAVTPPKEEPKDEVVENVVPPPVETPDDTISNEKIPDAGITVILVAVTLVLMGTGIIAYVVYKKMRIK